jgi:hypothetical protein
MLAIAVLIAVLFSLCVTFFIGWYAGLRVPDEVKGGRKYFALLAHAVLVVMAFVFLLQYSWQLALFSAVLILVRNQHAQVLLGGLMLGLEQTLTLALLCLVMNFSLGVIAKDRKMLLRMCLLQIVGALLAFLATYLKRV